MANNPIVNMFRVKELRERLLFTLGVLAVFRLGSILTVPGISPQALTAYFDSFSQGNAFVDYMDFFAGGAFSNFSVFMLGVMPYISSQIIMNLALIIFPSLKRISQEEGGQRKVQSWTRIATVFVAMIQGYAGTVLVDSIPNAVVMQSTLGFTLLFMLTVTTGTMIAIWLGEQITARGIGNGISMIIFAGIVARLPAAVVDLYEMVREQTSMLPITVLVAIMFFVIICLVVYEQQGQRKIPIHYAKRVVGRKMYGGQNTYIPFKLNPSGVIPVIFASSFLTFPLQIATSLGPNVRWLNRLAAVLTPTGWVYNIALVLLIVFFAYFYTQVTLNPTEMAKNIRENGGSIPGIRTDNTETYLQRVLNRLVLPGSLYLAGIAVLPTIVQNLFGLPQSISMLLGGTSLLILVGVDLDTMTQVDALLKMHHHDGLAKKGKLRGRNL